MTSSMPTWLHWIRVRKRSSTSPAGFQLRTTKYSSLFGSTWEKQQSGHDMFLDGRARSNKFISISGRRSRCWVGNRGYPFPWRRLAPLRSSKVSRKYSRMRSEDKQLSGRVCLIAGASGAIGCAVANRFRQEGASLAVTYLTQRPALIEDNIPGFPLNVCDWNEVRRVVQEVMQAFGKIDVLVNCTGVLGPIGPVSNTDPAAWIKAVEINFVGSFYLTRAVLPLMMKQNGGKILHFSG